MAATEDLFTPIHKALRSMIYSLSGRLQVHDFADIEATKTLITDLENDFAVARSASCVLCVLSQHATDEEGQIFPSVQKVQSQLVSELIAEHHDLTRRELAIAKAGHELLSMDRAEARLAAGISLNQAANDLFGAYIVHMNREERELVPLMRQHFSDVEMAAMRGRILGAIPPDRYLGVLGWMVSSLNVTELSGLLAPMRQAAPPPVFKAVVDLCGKKVEPARWNAVKLRIGL